MTTQDYYNIVPDENGWRMLPNGDKFKLGVHSIIGDWVKIGNNASIGTYVSIGNGAYIGNDVEIGDGTIIGKGATIDDDVSVSNNDKTTYLVTVINSAGDYLEHKLFNSLIEAEQCAKGFGSHCTIEIWNRVSNNRIQK